MSLREIGVPPLGLSRALPPSQGRISSSRLMSGPGDSTPKERRGIGSRARATTTIGEAAVAKLRKQLSTQSRIALPVILYHLASQRFGSTPANGNHADNHTLDEIAHDQPRRCIRMRARLGHDYRGATDDITSIARPNNPQAAEKRRESEYIYWRY